MKQTFRAFLLTASLLTALPAFAEDKPADKAPTSEAASGKDYTIIKLGSDEIKQSEVLDIWKGLFPGGSAPDFASFDENIRQNVLRGLVSERLLYQEALKSGADKTEEVKKRIAQAQKQITIQSFIEQKAKSMASDEQIKTLYQTKVDAAKGQEEVKAKHILVASEEEAKKIVEQLKKGGDFDKIAKEKSTDKGSGVRGGDLGWFTKDKMVPEFADAAYKLKKGELSSPIKSQFGWHVIKLEDRRPVKVASLEEMKESLKQEASGKAVESYVEGLLKSADIKYYAPDGSEKPFARELSPAAGKPEAAPAEKK